MSIHSHYDTLNVTRDAPREVIVAAFKGMAQKYHPDRNIDNPEAVQLMQVINGAYRILTDPVMRQEHDAWIALQEPPKPKAPPTPQELETKKKIDAALDEAAKWNYWAERAASEAKSLRDKANKAAALVEQAKIGDRDKYRTAANAAAAEALTAENNAKQAADAALARQKECDETIAKLQPPGTRAAATHYDTLYITPIAPPEVIQFVYKILGQQNAPGTPGARNIDAAFAVLSDPAKKAEYDAKLQKALPPAQQQQAGGRKQSAKEAETQAAAEAAAKEYAKYEALAGREMNHAREAQAKADEAAKTAAAKAKDKDAAAWKTYADKLAAEAVQERRKADRAVAQAMEVKAKADAAAKEAAAAKAEGEKERARWGG